MQTGAMFSENNFRDLSFSFLQGVDAEFNLTAHVVNFLHEHLAVLPTKKRERKHIRKDALCHFSQGSLGHFCGRTLSRIFDDLRDGFFCCLECRLMNSPMRLHRDQVVFNLIHVCKF